MKDKRIQMVADLAAPHLRQGEQIEMTLYAKVGSVSVKQVAATAAVVAAATAVSSGCAATGCCSALSESEVGRLGLVHVRLWRGVVSTRRISTKAESSGSEVGADGPARRWGGGRRAG
jgi:hypothetical protein